MSLYRHFPTPSDRMGIIWTVLPVKDTVVIEYGPSGTTHYGAETIMDLGIDVDKNLFCTHLDQDDIIMGDITRLENAIYELEKQYSPKCIFVVGSSLTSVIAADITGLCLSIQDNVSSLLIPFEHGGFRGDYSLGIEDALVSLAENITAEAGETEKGVYNIIGACYDSYRIGSDVEEIREIMWKCFGMKAGCVIPYDCSFDEVKNCASAELSIVLREEGVKAAKVIAGKGNCPYIFSTPYGYNGTLRFIEQMAEVLGMKPDEGYVSFIKSKANHLEKRAMQIRFSGLDVSAVIEGNLAVVKGLSSFLKEEVGFSISCGICTHSLRNMRVQEDYIKHFLNEREKLNLLKGCRDCLVLASDPTLFEVDSSNVKLKTTYPSFGGISVATHLPFMGYKGADYIMEFVEDIVNRVTIKTMMQ